MPGHRWGRQELAVRRESRGSPERSARLRLAEASLGAAAAAPPQVAPQPELPGLAAVLKRLVEPEAVARFWSRPTMPVEVPAPSAAP
jgi:hypothetical protein